MSAKSRRQVVTGLLAGAAGWMLSARNGRLNADDLIKEIAALKPGQFTWHPERSPDGPVAIIVSIPEQRVHVYRNAIRIAVSTCSTGKEGHSTPTGVFTILEKDKNHHSSTYNNAPMPNMNRLTWSGVALHAGNLPGYPASHGCIRLPLKFSELLFGITHVGTAVVVAGSHSDPAEVIHPGLVLGDYAAHEFDSAAASVRQKELPWAAHVTSFAAPTSIVISSADRIGIMTVDGKVIGEAPVTIANPEVPLGSHVFMLMGAHDGQQGLAWHAITHHDQAGQQFGQTEVSVLTRISTSAETRNRVRDYLHSGMILVTTDLPAHADTRTGRDFVVMSQDMS